jgi:hypothetical protein
MPSQTLIDQLQGMWPFNMGMPPSWLSQAQQQTQRDIAAYQQGGVPALMADTGSTQDLAGGFVGSTTPVKGIKAYHGSPYDFDKFDLSRIGTGEGAQTYGHGLYFAENPAVAESYKNDPKMMAWTRGKEWTPDQEEAFEWLHRNNYDQQAASADIMRRISQARQYGDSLDSTASLFNVKNLIDSGWQPPRGRMYKVNINASPEQFLNWDDPASRASYNTRLDDLLRAQPLDSLGLPANHVESMNRAVLQLSNEGIPGIRYLDQGSRSGGQGTSNYVVFNPDIVEILKKYGWAGALPFGTGAMPNQQSPATPPFQTGM